MRIRHPIVTGILSFAAGIPVGILLASILSLSGQAQTIQAHVREDVEQAPAVTPQAQNPVVMPIRPSHGIIGVNFQLRPGSFPFIVEVYPGTPAQRAGLISGDVLVAVNGYSTRGVSPRVLNDMISKIPGNTVHLMIVRQGRMQSVPIKVQALETVPSTSIQRLYRSLF